jgi:hypothetical protein
MKNNWPAVVKEFRSIVLANVKLYGAQNPKQVSKGFTEYFKIQLNQTDTFHPFDTDGELSRALDNMPERCNYRSCDSYHAWKDGRCDIADALYAMLTEASELIEYHFSDKWNFAPGAPLPARIDMPRDWTDYAESSVSRIIKAAKKA